jgi:hypothetical protein
MLNLRKGSNEQGLAELCAVLDDEAVAETRYPRARR